MGDMAMSLVVKRLKPAGAVQVDAETAKRMGSKVEPVARQRLAFGIKTTGKIEPHCPTNKSKSRLR